MRKVLFTAAAAVVAVVIGTRGWAGDEPPTAGKERAANVKTQVVEYKDGDVVCKGYLAGSLSRSLGPVARRGSRGGLSAHEHAVLGMLAGRTPR